MGLGKQHEPVTIERLERGLMLLAYLIDRYGDAHVPMYERLERELETLKRSEDTKDRARQRLEANRHWLVELGLKE